MSVLSARRASRVAGLAAVAVLVLISIPPANGQMPSLPQMGSSVPNQTQIGQSGGTMNDQLQYGTFGHQVERDQDAAYQAFLKERDSAKKIRLGNEFLRKYPKSPLAERVDAGLMNVYRSQQDWKDCYQSANAALALQPDDVDVLTTVGWTIPHVYNPNDANADQKLNTAETYAKHAIEVLAKLPKPGGMSNEQFAAAKQKRYFQAHSALGLVYFRRDDYDNSAKELEQSTKGNPKPDPTDLFVLGSIYKTWAAMAKRQTLSADAARLQDPCRISASRART